MYTGVECCLSDGVIFAVVVVCQQKQQRQLQHQEWWPWENRWVENNFVIDIVSVQKGLILCVLKGPVLCVVIVLET